MGCQGERERERERVRVAISVEQVMILSAHSGLVGVWSDWGYGISIFEALNFQTSESLKFGENHSLCGAYFPGKFGPRKTIWGLWKTAIPYATNPYPHSVPADIVPRESWQVLLRFEVIFFFSCLS